MSKETVLCTYNGILFSFITEKIPCLLQQNEWTGDAMLSEMSVPEGQIPHDSTYMKYLK